MISVTRIDTANTVRIAEVVNALFSVFEERGIGKEQSVSIAELDVAMEARGYAGKWTRRAVELLHEKQIISLKGSSIVVLADNPFAQPRAKKPREPRRRVPRSNNI